MLEQLGDEASEKSSYVFGLDAISNNHLHEFLMMIMRYCCIHQRDGEGKEMVYFSTVIM